MAFFQSRKIVMAGIKKTLFFMGWEF